MLRPGQMPPLPPWLRHCLQDRIVSLLQVMHAAKYPEFEASCKNCHTDICFKTKTVVAHVPKCWNQGSGVRRKFSWGSFHSEVYGGHLYLVCPVYDVTIWRQIHVSKPTFWWSLLTWYAFSSASTPLSLCHWTEYKLSALQVRMSEENTLNATTQQFITAKISGCALKQGSKTHSSLRQSNLQLQNDAALISCRIWAVEHRNCAAGLSDIHPGLQDRIWLN